MVPTLLEWACRWLNEEPAGDLPPGHHAGGHGVGQRQADGQGGEEREVDGEGAREEGRGEEGGGAGG